MAPSQTAEETGALLSLLLTKRILISVGSGGVGKTTVAAALGLQAAREGGRRTLVMTIDPARRLATSLGLDELSHDPQPVPRAKLRPHGVARGLLNAMMLDPKRTFDDMVRRYAPDGATMERLLRSRMYQQISSRLAGAQEYAAMEKLHAIRQTGSYDLLVLDTPPTTNALDFLEAPRKMVDAVESPAISLFVNTYRRAGKLSLGLLGFGAAYVVRRLARFTGHGFLDDIAHFLGDLSGLLGGMHDRAAQVMALLASDEVGFVIVTSPDPRSIDEAVGFHDRLVSGGMRPAAVIVNRVQPLVTAEIPEQEELARQILATGRVSTEMAPRLARALLESHDQIQALARADVAEIARLQAYCGAAVPFVQVPLFNEDVFDVDGLLRLGSHLV
jgi:anion-transporting  ArsA/GET3 family ATPase